MFLLLQMRKLWSAMRLPFSLLILTMLAWVLFWPLRAIINIFPLSRLVRFYGNDEGTNVYIPLASSCDINRANFIRRAISIAAKYSPASANCYPQALAALLLLKWARVPYGMYFGIAKDKDTGKMIAHTWVMTGRVPVSGGNSFRTYTVVRSFISTSNIE